MPHWNWKEVLDTINLGFGTSLSLDAKLFVLAYVEGEGDPGYRQTAMFVPGKKTDCTEMVVGITPDL